MFATEGFKSSQLARIYNVLAVTLDLKTVERFSDHETATKRVRGLVEKLDAAGKTVAVDDEGVATVADKPKPVAPVVVTPEPTPEPTPVPVASKPVAPRAANKVRVKVAKSTRKQAKSSTASVAETDVIVVLHQGDNPKKANAAARFALYKTGMTVGAYIDAVAGLHLDPPARQQALRDLAWDTKQRWVQVVGARFYAEAMAREAAARESEKVAAAA